MTAADFTTPEPSADGLSADEIRLGSRAFVAPGAVLVGQVRLGRSASVWYGCVVRGDLAPIEIGDESNVQDLSLIHVDPGRSTTIGAGVTIGHRAIVHAAQIDDGALIGMGAIVLSGAHVGRDALVGAGAVVREGFEVPDGAIVVGVPARVVGRVDDRHRRRAADGVRRYLQAAAAYRSGRLGSGPYGGRPSEAAR